MGKYDRQKANALRQIKAKGAAVTWRKVTLAPEDETKPWKASATPVDYPVSIMFYYDKGKFYGLLHAVSFTPDKNDVVINPDGSELTIVTFEPVAPDGDSIIYTIEFENALAIS